MTTRQIRSLVGVRVAARPVALLAALLLAALGASWAWGYWSLGDATGNGAAQATSLNQGPTPTVVGQHTTVTVSWGTATATNGHAADGYIIKRYDAGSGVPQTVGLGCSGVVTVNTCTEAGLPAGQWTYTITPTIGVNWLGGESPHSGVVQTGGPTTLTLAKTVFGSPLPAVTTGAITGFLPDEGITYTLDGTTPIVGSPSSAGIDGTATITSLTIPAGTPDGTHTIAAVGHNPVSPSLAQASILIDTTPPTITAIINPAPNAAGWNNTSPVDVTAAIDTSGGSGLASIWYTNDGSDPITSPTRINGFVGGVVATVAVTQTTTFKFYAVDQAGNATPVQTLTVRIDTTAPVPTSAALLNVTGGAYLNQPAGITYYRGAVAGSFELQTGATDPGGAAASGLASASNTVLNGSDAGFTINAGTVTTPPGGPFVLNPVSWVAGTTSNPVGTVVITDVAGNSIVFPAQLLNDSAAPSGGSLDASGLSGPGGRYSTSLTLNLDLAKGSDSGSGLADGSAPADPSDGLLRASATLSSSDGVANATCGTYSSYVQLQANPPATVSDTVPSDHMCYRYKYLVADHVGNVATYTSPDIKVQTTAAPSLTPSAVALTPVSGVSSQSVSGSTVYYNPANSGSFQVTASASAPYAGIAQMTFPAITGFTGGGAVTTPLSGTTFGSTYAWTANSSSTSPGVQSLSATNNAGQTATNASAFTVVADSTGPGGGSVGALGLGGTGARYSTSRTLSVAFSPGTDSGAGLAASGAQLLRASAGLSSNGTADGTCGTYGPYTQVGANDPTSPFSDTVPADSTCYRYEYVVADKVGNQTTYTSPDVKVDTTAPPAPALGFSALSNAYWSSSTTTLFYRPAASSGNFTVTASSADAHAGITGYGLPTLPSGWSSTPGAAGVESYAWTTANPTAPTGPLTVSATNNAGTQTSSSFTASADSTAPAGGSVTYTNGTIATTTAPITLSSGTDTGSGIAAGSAQLQRQSATLTGSTCGSYGAFSTIATAPSSPYTDTVAANTCYRYRYLVSDNVANQATYTSASILKVTASQPTHALTLLNPIGAYLKTGNLYYNSNASGSFSFVDALTSVGSTPTSVTYPSLSLSGWTHAAETVSTPSGGPFPSSTFSWSAHPNSPGSYTVTGLNSAMLQGTTTVNFISDQTPPSGGNISYLNGTLTTPSVAITTADGTDTQSGINPTAGIIKRDTTTLDTSTESCAQFPGTFATTVTVVGGADTSVSNGHCYQYRYLPSDNVGNQATYTSGRIVKLDTTPKVTAISSGNGTLQNGDQLVITFNENLASATVPSTFANATLARAASGNTMLTIPGITDGALDTGTNGYLTGNGAQTATFGGTVALNNNGANTTITLTVTSLSGSTTSAGSGRLTFKTAPTITGADGTGATGTFLTDPQNFKLF